MKCFEDVVYSEFLDNELKPEVRKQVISHLKDCEKCQIIVERLKKENVQLKDLFEMDQNPPDLVPIIMNKITSPESRYLKKGNPWPSLIYGLLLLIGILAPYFLSIYLKSTGLFQNILSFLFTPLSLISSIGSFILREIVLINSDDITRMIVGQIVIIILFALFFSSSLIKPKKTLKEDIQ